MCVHVPTEPGANFLLAAAAFSGPDLFEGTRFLAADRPTAHSPQRVGQCEQAASSRPSLSLSLSSILSWSKRIPLPPCLSLAVASDKSNCRRRHGRRHSLRPPVAKVKPRSADVLPPTSWNTVPCFDCWVHLPVLATSVNLIAADLHNRPLKDPHNLHMQNH